MACRCWKIEKLKNLDFCLVNFNFLNLDYFFSRVPTLGLVKEFLRVSAITKITWFSNKYNLLEFFIHSKLLMNFCSLMTKPKSRTLNNR